MIRNHLTAIISCLILTVAASAAQAVESVDTLVFGGANLGYGDKSDFVCLNRGNLLARVASEHIPTTVRERSREFLFCPDRDIYIALDHGKAHIAKGAVVELIDDSGCVAILNLFDTSSGAVSYREDGREYKLNPGESLILRERDSTVPLLIKRMPFRRVSAVISDHFHSIVIGEFSIASALANLPRLRAIYRSQRPSEQRLAKKLVKIAAAHQTVTSAHGPFGAIAWESTATAKQ